MVAKAFAPTGGMERCALELARAMLARGHKVDLFCRNCQAELLPGAAIYRLPERFRFSSVINAWDLALSVRRQLAGRSYDVIHSHERTFCQDVLTLHCFSFRGGLEHYRGWRRWDQHYCSPRNAMYLMLERRQLAATPWPAAVSGTVLDDYRRYCSLAGTAVIIPPGVDPEWFHPAAIQAARPAARQRLGYGDERLVVLFAGSEFQRKGLDFLLEAAALVPGVELLVAGRGDRAAHFNRLVERLGLRERVRFLGLVGEMREVYAAADVVALPSRSEAFGMSVLEGMACGLPVIVAPNAGAAALVEHGVNGCTGQSPAALREGLEALRDPARRQEMGRRARLRAENYGWRQMADAYENIYYQVAASKARS